MWSSVATWSTSRPVLRRCMTSFTRTRARTYAFASTTTRAIAWRCRYAASSTNDVGAERVLAGSTRPQAKAFAVIARRQRRLALEQFAEARHVAVAAALDDFVEAQLRGFQQGLGAFDAQMLDVAKRRRAEVRAEMPQQ